MVVKSQALGTALPALRLAVGPWLALLKLRIVALLVFVSMVTAILAADGRVPIDRLILLLVAGALSSAGSAALNQYFERDIDSIMARTRHRPLPSGDISPHLALALGVTLLAGAAVPAVALGPRSAVAMFTGAFFYVCVYTMWLKRNSAWNVPIGGFAGSCAVLAGWLAVQSELTAPAPLLLAAILFFWNQSHFWALAIARRTEYRDAGVPMLPVVVGARAAAQAILLNTVALVTVSLAMYLLVPMHAIYLVGAIVAGLLFLRQNITLLASPTPQAGWSNFKFSGVYLLVLFLSIAVDSMA